MTEVKWLHIIEAMLPYQECLPVPVSARKLRLFMVACCRSIPGFLWLDDNCIRAVTVAERYADGYCSEADLDRANSMMSCECADHQGDRAREAIFCTTIKKAIEGIHLCFHYAQFATLERDRGDPEHRETNSEVRLAAVRMKQARLACCIFGDPLRSAPFLPSYRTDTAVSLAQRMYVSREFSAMPILADALQDAGCDNDDILSHLRGGGPHVKGCWALDALLGKT